MTARLLLLLALSPLGAATTWIEGESLVPADRPRGVDGAPPGWYRVAYLYGDESAAWSLVSARRLGAGQVSRLTTRLTIEPGRRHVWVRVGCRDRAAQAGFTLRLGDHAFTVQPDPARTGDQRHVWLRLTDQPVDLPAATTLTIEDSEPTTVAALDVLALTDEDPTGRPLPAWPGAAEATGVSARWWVPALFDQPLALLRGGCWPVLLAVTNAGAAPVSGARVTLDLPPGVTLVDPSGRESLGGDDEHFSFTPVAPRSVERQTSPAGERVTLELGELPAKLDGMRSNRGVVALFLSTAENAQPGPLTVTTTAPGQEPARVSAASEVLDLPPGAGPAEAWWLLDAPYLVPFAPAERQAWLATVKRLGYNRVNLLEGLRHDDPARDRRYAARYAEVAQEVRLAGLEPVLGMVRWIPWSPYRTYSDRYLAAHPEAAAVQAPGSRAATQQRGVVSPTHLLSAESTYFDAALDAYADLARQAGIQEIYWDDEENRPLEGSFDPATLELFRRHTALAAARAGLGPAPPLDAETILADATLREAWVRFRCEQNATICALVRRRLAARVRNLRLFVYSGFQGPATQAQYGVDWGLAAPYAHGVIAGSGWANALMIPQVHDTWRVVRQANPAAQTMFVEHAINDWPGTTRWSDPSTTAARMVLAAAAGAPGVNDCCSIYTMEGHHLAGMAAAARFVAAHETVLLKGTRRLVDTNDDGFTDTVVVEHRGATLTVTANATQHPQTFRPRQTPASPAPEALLLEKGEWRVWGAGE